VWTEVRNDRNRSTSENVRELDGHRIGQKAAKESEKKKRADKKEKTNVPKGKKGRHPPVIMSKESKSEE